MTDHRCVAFRHAAGVAGLLLIVISAACRRDDGVGGDGDAAPTPVSVTAVQARMRALNPRMEFVGRLETVPENTARVSSRVAGTIVEVGAIEGRQVAAGQMVVRLDATLFGAAASRATAVVAERKAVLERLQQGPRPEEIDAARANLRRAEAVVRSTAARLEALERLAAGAELSLVRLEDVRAARDSAVADRDAARAALDLLEAGTRPESLEEARAGLSAAQGDLAAAAARERFAVVTAPLAGTVTALTARVGLGVAAADILMEIVDLRTLLLRIRVPATVVPKVAADATCELRFDALDGQLVEGVVDRWGVLGDAATGGVWAYVAVANEAGLLRPNMMGRAAVRLLPLPPAVVVPEACVAERAGVAVVTVIRDGLAAEIAVQSGARADGWVQILSGVGEGDWVATHGGYGLPDGQPVTIVTGTEPDAGR